MHFMHLTECCDEKVRGAQKLFQQSPKIEFRMQKNNLYLFCVCLMEPLLLEYKKRLQKQDYLFKFPDYVKP